MRIARVYSNQQVCDGPCGGIRWRMLRAFNPAQMFWWLSFCVCVYSRQSSPTKYFFFSNRKAESTSYKLPVPETRKSMSSAQVYSPTQKETLFFLLNSILISKVGTFDV